MENWGGLRPVFSPRGVRVGQVCQLRWYVWTKVSSCVLTLCRCTDGNHRPCGDTCVGWVYVRMTTCVSLHVCLRKRVSGWAVTETTDL